MNTILKYCLSTYDLRRAGRRGGENAPPWENKSIWIFYIELITGIFQSHATYRHLNFWIRLPQIDDLPCLLLCHYCLLRITSEYCPGCLCHCPFLHHAV